jgi:hypothetical protein
MSRGFAASEVDIWICAIACGGALFRGDCGYDVKLYYFMGIVLTIL